MECYCYLRAAQLSRSRVGREDSVRTAFRRTINRPVIPFGSMVQYHPISPKDQARLYQFGEKDLLDIFVGYALFALEIWKDDTLVAHVEELNILDASEIHARRLNVKEVLAAKNGE